MAGLTRIAFTVYSVEGTHQSSLLCVFIFSFLTVTYVVNGIRYSASREQIAHSLLCLKFFCLFGRSAGHELVFSVGGVHTASANI